MRSSGDSRRRQGIREIETDGNESCDELDADDEGEESCSGPLRPSPLQKLCVERGEYNTLNPGRRTGTYPYSSFSKKGLDEHRSERDAARLQSVRHRRP